MKSFRFASRYTYLWIPACAASLLCAAGCTRHSELPLPHGAYVSPAEQPAIGSQDAVPAETSIDTLKDVPAQKDAVVIDETFEIQPEIPEATVDVRRPEMEPEQTASAFIPVESTDKIYVVRKGDTVSAIAKAHRISTKALADYNGIDVKKALIFPEQILRIPATAAVAAAPADAKKTADSGKVYTVKAGDTLGIIAFNHGIKTEKLVELNDLDAKKPIQIGQKLRLPEGAKLKPQDKQLKPLKAKEKKPAAKPAQPQAKKPVVKVEKPVAPPEPAPAKVEPVKTDAAPVKVEPVKEEPAKAEPAKVVPVEDSFADAEILSMTLPRAMTLEEAAKNFDRPYAALKKLNPGIAEDTVLDAGTDIKIPLF